MSDLKQLAVFAQVARSGSFTGAAAQLGVTPSAVSKTLTQLENSLGMRLFNRTTRQLHITPQGRLLFERLSAALASVDSAIDDAREMTQEYAGTLRVSVAATFGRYYLAPILSDFIACYPNINISARFDDSARDLIAGQFDVGVHLGEGRNASYVSRLLCDYPIVLVASPGYLARRGVPQAPEDLARHDCIGSIRPDGAAATWQLELAHPERAPPGASRRFIHAPVNPKVTVEAQLDLTLSLALHGAGVAPAALISALALLRQGRLKVLLPDYRVRALNGWESKIFVFYPHRAHVPLKVRAFVDFLLGQTPAEISEDSVGRFAA